MDQDFRYLDDLYAWIMVRRCHLAHLRNTLKIWIKYKIYECNKTSLGIKKVPKIYNNATCALINKLNGNNIHTICVFLILDQFIAFAIYQACRRRSIVATSQMFFRVSWSFVPSISTCTWIIGISFLRICVIVVERHFCQLIFCLITINVRITPYTV